MKKKKRMKANAVFTPRLPEINPLMYVKRPRLESSLKRALDDNIHILLFGDSGSGKSWLYKKVLAEEKIPYVVANCSNAARLSSVTEEIVSVLVEAGTATKTSYTETKSAELSAVVLKGELKHAGDYDVKQKDPLLHAFEKFSQRGPGKKIIALDNLERIFRRTELMDELANILVLQDDPRYAKHKISFLIVGVPDVVLEYFSRTQDLPSVANRIYECDKVTGLTKQQVKDLVTKGFKLLGVNLNTAKIMEIVDHVHRITIGIPQRVHEYCKCLAWEMEQLGWSYKQDMLKHADDKWLSQGFRTSFTAVTTNLNKGDPSVGRKNQVIYVLGQSNKLLFDPKMVENLVKKEFPHTIPKSGVIQTTEILKELSTGKFKLLNRLQSTAEYCFVDPRDIMCIRVFLYKAASGAVRKKSLSR